MLPIKYLYASLRLSLAKMALVTLLQRHDKGLESLAEDLAQIIKDKESGELYKQSSMIDYKSYLEQELDYEIDQEQIQEELEWLIEELQYLIKRYQREFPGQLRGIHFEFPNTVIFETLQPKIKFEHRRR